VVAVSLKNIGFPLSFLNSPRARQMSAVMVGFGLLFLGLAFLKSGVPNLKTNPEALQFLTSLTGYGFFSTLAFVLVGTILTIVVQSSSAAMALTLTMAHKGWISYELAAAMVLGENIGTTVTANLAAIGASRNANRVARFHTRFNLIGVLWILPLMGLALEAVSAVLPMDPKEDPTKHLALFHSAFNIANTMLLIGFAPKMVKLVERLIPRRPDEHEGSHFSFLETSLLGTPELATVEASRGLKAMTERCGTMFGKLKRVLTNPKEKLGNLVDDIKRDEVATDEMEEEIVDFCSQLARAGSSETIGSDVALYLDAVNDIERVGDHCVNLILLAERRYEKRYDFGDEARSELAEMLEYVEELLALTADVFDKDSSSEAHARAEVLEAKINKHRDTARKAHAQRMQDGKIRIRSGLIYLDMLTNLEKIGDYCWNVVLAMYRKYHPAP
jgi:phosphate:Na+ symporter